MSEQKNGLYWDYNLPLQVWPEHQDPEDENSEVIDAKILNYMPRKGRCCDLKLSDIIGEQTREDFFENAAQVFENLARLMRVAAKDINTCIYYPYEGMDKPK